MFYELLSEEEKAIIETMREIGLEEQGDFLINDCCSCEYFLRLWEEAKAERMSKVFGEKLILKKEINVFVEDEILHNKMSKITDSKELFEIKCHIFNMLRENNDIEKDIRVPETHSTTTCIGDELDAFMFNVDAFIKNKYMGITLELILPDGHIFKLVEGCKLMKAIGKLARAAKIYSSFETIRIKQSQIMNEANIQATLCLSIHPLDYMTASYNCNDWTSCMNWEKGEYRRGVIEMMNSPYVIVAYLESKRNQMDFWINSGKTAYWNSKKWREFIIVSDEGIFGIKGYPYWNHEVEDIALKWLAELFNDDYSTKITHWGVNSKAVDDSIGVKTDIFFDCGPGMYNDFYGGNEYHAIFSEAASEKEYIELHYSGDSECIVCGNEWCDFDTSGDLGCFNCIERHICCDCGNPIYNNDDLVIFEDREYCYDCYCYLPTCDCCKETKVDLDSCPSGQALNFVISKDDSAQSEILLDNFGGPVKTLICRDCASEVFVDKEEELDRVHLFYANWWHHNPIVPIKRISNIEALGLPSKYLDKLKIMMEKQEEIA